MAGSSTAANGTIFPLLADDACRRLNEAAPEVGPWAREKFRAVGSYLSFYTTALKKQERWVKSLTFVDAFAGAG